MKITDVTLTLFAWDDIPPTQYGQHSKFSGSSSLGLLRIVTDQGLEGHAFLGSASNPGDVRRAGADHASQAVPDGPRSDDARGDRAGSLAQAASCRRARHRRGRRGAVGSRRQGDGPADPSPARHLPDIGAGLCELGGAAVARGLCRAGARVQGVRLGRLQDPSADPWQKDIKVCEAVRRAVGDYTIMLDSTWAYDFPTRCASARRSRRWATTGTRIRCTSRTSTTT